MYKLTLTLHFLWIVILFMILDFCEFFALFRILIIRIKKDVTQNNKTA